METRGTTGEETISYWFDLPIDVAEFEEKLGIGAESGDYRIIEKVLPYADEVHEHTSVYQLNELDFMYRQLSSDMQEEYVSLLTVFENLEALYICRNVIIVYPDCKSMIDVARQKLMNDPMFKHGAMEKLVSPYREQHKHSMTQPNICHSRRQKQAIWCFSIPPITLVRM